MAQQGIQLDQEKLCCSICLDLLKQPVTIPCGHSYCVKCIESYWDEEGQKENHSCPQCRQAFMLRPVLVKNTVLADLVEELKKKTGPQAAPADHGCAGPGVVACDVCTGRQLKAVKSCLQCLVSYCEQHVQPHYDSPAFGKHKLVEPSEKLQENVCTRHCEVTKIFCRTDRQLICYLCSMDEHRGHDAVSAKAEIAERRGELGARRQSIQQKIQSRERGVKLLQREIAALKKQDIELEQLEHTEDPTQFLHRYTSLSRPGDAADAGSEVRDEPRDVLSEEWTESPPRGGAEVDDSLLPRGELKTRAEFFKCSRQITLDPNTAHHYIAIDRGVKARCRPKNPEYPIHPDKFTSCSQVLSREGLTGRCYWEVKWDTREVFVAVAYKSIKRAGEESAFGNNDKSWALQCWQSGYELTHNSVRTAISGPESSRVGLYVDHGAGTLSFYSVSDTGTMTLLHTVYTTFRQPLCAGLGMYVNGASAEIYTALDMKKD
ncbi:fish virus induced TRIM protein-like [Scophthalmus maximus]|uniref:Fish virus induced TRIM protein-like n=1 Tax=Scophthalmus maximus TaxID=52904 RepID=A0A2U9CEH2_SCOMX|nr:E3 ubiquitin/ISG15 ligase TRIM25 [Scophthalmus maximus]AWP14897.1 fish virus induced TRIM protein-like [Scophthalmus maximus]KAF0031268.1 hypothetical protein F2P81_015823 [Scophthalmus maximus]